MTELQSNITQDVQIHRRDIRATWRLLDSLQTSGDPLEVQTPADCSDTQLTATTAFIKVQLDERFSDFTDRSHLK